MLRTALVMLMLGGMTAWCQTPKNASPDADKIPKADMSIAYYHFMRAQMYAEKAAALGVRIPRYVPRPA